MNGFETLALDYLLQGRQSRQRVGVVGALVSAEAGKSQVLKLMSYYYALMFAPVLVVEWVYHTTGPGFLILGKAAMRAALNVDASNIHPPPSTPLHAELLQSAFPGMWSKALYSSRRSTRRVKSTAPRREALLQRLWRHPVAWSDGLTCDRAVWGSELSVGKLTL